MNGSFLIDDVTVFGTQRGQVSAHDANITKITKSDYLHIIRHFSQLDQKSREELMRTDSLEDTPTPVTNEMIDTLLQTAGSKFNSKLQDLSNVLSLLLSYTKQHIENGLIAPWIEYTAIPGKYFCEISFTITPDQKVLLRLKKTDAVGSKGVVLIDQTNKAFINKEMRGKGGDDAIQVNIIKDRPAPHTDSISVCLVKEIETLVVQLGSIYTSDGLFSPPFPNAQNQSKEEFAYNQTWWQERAFYN